MVHNKKMWEDEKSKFYKKVEDETKGMDGNEDYNVLVEKTAAGKKRKNVDQKDGKDGSYVWGEEGRTEEDQQRKKIFLMDGPAIITSTKQ